MCAICGCDDHPDHNHDHDHAHGQGHHHHRHRHDDAAVVPGHSRDEPATLTAHFSGERLVEVEQAILGKNDAHAGANRARLQQLGILSLNLVSSPGAGKTSLLVATIDALRRELPIVVIEGDQETDHDALRIRACGVPAVQINTGRGCHLDAHGVGHALDDLPLAPGSLLFIENIGNLVCPASFDLGEDAKVAILSVAEGDDKPVKYPGMFAACEVMVISKIDLLPHVEFDLARAVDRARRINPQIEVLALSVKSGEGMPEWLHRIRGRAAAKLARHLASLDDQRGRMRARLQALDAMRSSAV
jgi:hydrogenase nickel incorporation protein HypB